MRPTLGILLPFWWGSRPSRGEDIFIFRLLPWQRLLFSGSKFSRYPSLTTNFAINERPRISIDFTSSIPSSCQKQPKAESTATAVKLGASTGSANGLIESICSQGETFMHCVVPPFLQVYDIRNCVGRCAFAFGKCFRWRWCGFRWLDLKSP